MRHVSLAEQMTVREILDEGRTVEKVMEIAWNGAGWAEKSTRDFTELTGVEPGLACRKGCSYCCHLQVVAQIPDVIRIAQFLKHKLSPEELATVRERIEGYHAITSKFSGADWFKSTPACPLLVDGECSVHNVRPLACRGWNSQDVEGCKAYFEHPERRGTTRIYYPQLAVSTKVAEGIEAGLKDAGVKAHSVELVSGLRIALDVPDAAERWLGGEPVFEAARHMMDDPEYAKAQRDAQALNVRAIAEERLVQIGMPH